jgi:hypothetical protein
MMSRAFMAIYSTFNLQSEGMLLNWLAPCDCVINPVQAKRVPVAGAPVRRLFTAFAAAVLKRAGNPSKEAKKTPLSPWAPAFQ